MFEVFLVEDNEADVFLFKRAISEWKNPHQLTIARDGEEAIKLLNRDEKSAVPALIVLDLNLPKLSGFDVLTHIKKTPSLSSIPTVIYTGSNNQEEAERAYQLKADRFVQKPSDLKEYIKAVCEMENLLKP